jgi:hypothetical protein
VPNKLLCHISGPKGCGKTTVGKYLQKVFWDCIIVKDLDEFDPAKDIDWNSINNINNFLRKRFELKQKKVDAFLKSATKPVVFVGLHTEGCHVLNIPTCNRFILPVTADQAAVNAVMRSKKHELNDTKPEHPSHKADTEIQDLPNRKKEAQRDIEYLHSIGYVKRSARQIETWIRENL